MLEARVETEGVSSPDLLSGRRSDKLHAPRRMAERGRVAEVIREYDPEQDVVFIFCGLNESHPLQCVR